VVVVPLAAQRASRERSFAANEGGWLVGSLWNTYGGVRPALQD